ncbi:type 2 isopentenyl-diphosphate Delta-isomerase [Paenibacillus xerothermodurans]|uniref:Isopentenyl-diphosphate delta-isomerase n=1 Tax=Paenibacillus xerothermodurans TaxID=1977292 RepID=A0A2W1NR32_PAEXE|nr:type 2 isopentenyl-diphosphate Delta-isomerase [Paenibacillus xerothermodurans]PZE21965.1 type 2 isopentenyl-diphosphate Delta-isomerase [Paenibacillus xerothermodurans]
MRIPRKMEHVHHALALGQSGEQGFSDIKFIPNCLPDTSVERISLQTLIGELSMSSPIIINAMTGGAPETADINRDLAIAARETGLAMAVGSQMSAIKHPEVEYSYRVVREVNQHGIVFGNLGSEATLEQAERAVDMLRADGLQIHLNVMQELIMPEGDRDFTGMLERIAGIAQHLGVPVVVKEVGFGMARESVAALLQAGVQAFDVGGAGGTNFAEIENARRSNPMIWLNDWGVKTAVTLLESLHAVEQYRNSGLGEAFIIGSGGIRSAWEACKALTLGASAVGMAGALLRTVRTEGVAALIEQINETHQELKLLMAALGARTIQDLWQRPIVISGETAHWCDVRGISIHAYAARSGLIKIT